MNIESELLSFHAFGKSYVTIRISFEIDSQLSEDIISNITAAVKSRLSNSSTDTLEVIGFQPSSKCYTKSITFYLWLLLNRNIIHTSPMSQNFPF